MEKIASEEIKNADICYGDKEAPYHIHAKEANKNIKNLNRATKNVDCNEEINDPSSFFGTMKICLLKDRIQLLKDEIEAFKTELEGMTTIINEDELDNMTLITMPSSRLTSHQ